MEGHIRIILCDDHPVFRSGLKGVLESQQDFDVIAEAAIGAQAVLLAKQLRPDVMLIDLRMPEADGLSAVRAIKAESPGARVLVLTTFGHDSDIFEAIEAGAMGYLLKDVPPEEIIRAVRDTMLGNSPLSPAVAGRMMGRLRGDAEHVLSRRETEILGLVAKGRSNREIASELWISEATVKSHLNSAFDKLGAKDRTSAVVAAMKQGILNLWDCRGSFFARRRRTSEQPADKDGAGHEQRDRAQRQGRSAARLRELFVAGRWGRNLPTFGWDWGLPAFSVGGGLRRGDGGCRIRDRGQDGAFLPGTRPPVLRAGSETS